MTYEELDKLQTDLRSGTKHFYVMGKQLNVLEWFDLFLDFDNEKYNNWYYGNINIYFSIEGKTEHGYFNYKSTDAFSERISIK